MHERHSALHQEIQEMRLALRREETASSPASSKLVWLAAAAVTLFGYVLFF